MRIFFDEQIFGCAANISLAAHPIVWRQPESRCAQIAPNHYIQIQIGNLFPKTPVLTCRNHLSIPTQIKIPAPIHQFSASPSQKPPLFSQTRGEWWKTRLVFLATSPLSLALLREVRAAWPLIESAAEWETSSLRMKDEKNGTIRKEPGQQPFRTTCCSSRQPLSSPFPPRRPTKWQTRRHKKRPRREITPLMGGFLAAGESRKRSFCAYKPSEAARASAQRSPSMAAETMPPA